MNALLRLIIKAFFGIIKLFLYYIDICDVALIIFMTWVFMWGHFNWNGWTAVALGVAISLVAYIIFKHRIGFWIVTPLFSFVWTFVLIELLLKSVIMPDISQVGYWICAVLCFGWVIWLHRFANIRPQVIEIEERQNKPETEERWYDPRVMEMRPISTKPSEAYDPNWKYYSKSYLEADRK